MQVPEETRRGRKIVESSHKATGNQTQILQQEWQVPLISGPFLDPQVPELSLRKHISAVALLPDNSLFIVQTHSPDFSSVGSLYVR